MPFSGSTVCTKTPFFTAISYTGQPQGVWPPLPNYDPDLYPLAVIPCTTGMVMDSAGLDMTGYLYPTGLDNYGWPSSQSQMVIDGYISNGLAYNVYAGWQDTDSYGNIYYYYRGYAPITFAVNGYFHVNSYDWTWFPTVSVFPNNISHIWFENVGGGYNPLRVDTLTADYTYECGTAPPPPSSAGNTNLIMAARAGAAYFAWADLDGGLKFTRNLNARQPASKFETVQIIEQWPLSDQHNWYSSDGAYVGGLFFTTPEDLCLQGYMSNGFPQIFASNKAGASGSWLNNGQTDLWEYSNGHNGLSAILAFTERMGGGQLIGMDGEGHFYLSKERSGANWLVPEPQMGFVEPSTLANAVIPGVMFPGDVCFLDSARWVSMWNDFSTPEGGYIIRYAFGDGWPIESTPEGKDDTGWQLSGSSLLQFYQNTVSGFVPPSPYSVLPTAADQVFYGLHKIQADTLAALIGGPSGWHIWRSTDGGVTWTQLDQITLIPSGLNAPKTIANACDEETLYIAWWDETTGNINLIRSWDRGETWK